MPNDNEGVLFKNEKKRDGKKDADYQGQITIDGTQYWLSAWINKSKDGTKTFMGLKAKPKVENYKGGQDAGKPTISDEIPF